MAVGESLVPGTALKELRFENAQDWWVRWNDVAALWNAQPTYLLAQAAYVLGALLTLIHALSARGRLPFLWVATVCHGLVVEALSYFLPDVDNFWHSQTPLIFLGRRLPLHIVLLYPCFIYQATVAVSKLRLPRWAEPFAVGLTVVLIDIPYDIICVKFVHWTWHDTDPNIADRHYWVPWNSYYFHATFAAGFTMWFNVLRHGPLRWHRHSLAKETLNLVLASLLGTPTGVLMFTALYHPMHDLYKVHAEVTFFTLFAVFLSLAWAGSRCAGDDKDAKGPSGPSGPSGVSTATWRTWLLLLHLIVHYALWLGMAALGRPEREVSTGLHETIGPCDKTVPVQTASGLVLEKRAFLCASNYDEKYFDFHCLPKRPADGSHWYTICGTPFENRAEYVLVIGSITFTAAVFFFVTHFRSAPEGSLNPGKAGTAGTAASAAARKLKTK